MGGGGEGGMREDGKKTKQKGREKSAIYCVHIVEEKSRLLGGGRGGERWKPRNIVLPTARA